MTNEIVEKIEDNYKTLNVVTRCVNIAFKVAGTIAAGVYAFS